MPPLLFTDEDNHKIEIIGQIDRIDFNDNYYLVIDYKSGNAFIKFTTSILWLEITAFDVSFSSSKYYFAII